MNGPVRTLLYGNEHECRHTVELLNSLSAESGIVCECTCLDNWEEVQMKITDWSPNLAIVMEDGAAGMEAIFLVRKYRPDTPVFWFSDDNNFGMQAHRLECDYFSTKPITRDKMQKAFHRCAYVGVRF